MRFVTRVFGTLGTSVFTMVLAMIASIIIARSLGPEGRGTYALVVLLPALLIAVSNLGIGFSNNYYSAVGKYKLSSLVGNSVVLAGIIGGLVTAAFMIFWHVSPFDMFPEVRTIYITAAMGTVPLYLLDSYLAGILIGKLKIMQINLVAILSSLIKLLGVTILILVLKGGILYLVLLTIGVQVIISLSYLAILRKMTKLSFRFEFEIFKGIISYGVKSHIANTSTFLHYRADQFMVAYFLGVTQLGYYAVAAPIVELVFFIPRVINRILFSEVAGSIPERGADLTARVARHLVLVSLPLCLCIGAGAKLLVGILYGGQYLPAVAPLLILLPGVFLLSFAGTLSSYISGTGNVIFESYGSFGALALNIFLNLFLIQSMGISGAALATTISYSFLFLYTAVIFCRLSRMSVRDILVPRRSDITLLLQQLVKLCRWSREVFDESMGRRRNVI